MQTALTLENAGATAVPRASWVRMLGLATLVATVLLIATAALPSGNGGGALAQLRPQAAEAFQAGRDGDHVWAKITRGEVFGGVVYGVCRSIAGPVGWWVCPPLASATRQIIGGASGVWFEIYNTGRVRYGTW